MTSINYRSIFSIVPEINGDKLVERIVDFMDFHDLSERVEDLFLDSDFGKNYITITDYLDDRGVEDFTQFTYDSHNDSDINDYDEVNGKPWFYHFFAYSEVVIYLVRKFSYSGSINRYSNDEDLVKLTTLIYDAIDSFGYKLIEKEKSFMIDIVEKNELVTEINEVKKIINSYYSYKTQFDLQKKREVLREISVLLEEHKIYLGKFFGNKAYSTFKHIVNDNNVRHYNDNELSDINLHIMYDFAFNIGVSCFNVIETQSGGEY